MAGPRSSARSRSRRSTTSAADGRAAGASTSEAFVRSIFPRRILLHPSSLIDMRLWALNAIVFASAYGMLGFGLFFWRDAIVAGLTREFGPHAPPSGQPG